MNKFQQILVTLLLLLGSTWAGAEETTVKVASDRTAVLNVVDTAGDPEVSGTVKGAANLKEGKSGFRADLVVKDAAELQGAQADLYANMTGNTIEMIGYLNAKLPADPNAPKAFDVDVETVTEGDQSAANFDINFEGPMGSDPVPKGSGKATLKGDFKKFASAADFEFSGGSIKGSDVPFNKLIFNITEKENKTTIDFTVSAPKGSEFATQLASLPSVAPMLEGQLQQMQVKFEGLSFPAPVDEGTNTVGKGSLTLVDLRTTIKPYMGMMAMQMQGVPEAQKALEEMIEARIDKFSVTIEMQDTAVKGTIGMDVSNLEKFWNGYLTLLPSIQEVSNQQMIADAGEFGTFLAPLLKLNTEQAVESVKLLATSTMNIDAEMKFSLETSGRASAATTATPATPATAATPAEAGQTMSFKADGKMLSSNYQDYVTKAKAAGLPVAEKAVGKLEIHLKDQTTLDGDAYIYTDGPIIDYYKNMLAKAAKEGKAPEDVQKAITDLKLDDVGFKMSLKDNKIVILSRSTSSDLTKIASLIIKQAAPQFEADLTGGSVDVTMDDKGTGKSDLNFLFANFMPGKDAAAIKEALGLASTATVTMDAPADQVKLVAVEQPELTIDGKLADVQGEGQKLLASSPGEVASGNSGGGGGGSKWALIAIGVLLLAGVAGFLAFGRKS